MLSSHGLAFLVIGSSCLVSAKTPYTSLGCFNDVADTPALRENEKKGFISLDGTASARTDSINKCYQIAFQLGHNVFALQNGACFSMADFVPGGDYSRYGAASSCPAHGRGATLINNVYQIKDATNFNPDYSGLPYTSLGCWKDSTRNRALRPLEGVDAVLDSAPFARLDAIRKCYQAANFREMNIFGISDGGTCWGMLDNVSRGSYAIHGNATNCPRDGKGAALINHVYQIKALPQASAVLNYTVLPYTSLGCWNDATNVVFYALRLNEASLFSSTLDGPYSLRFDAVNKCYKVAQLRGHNIFSLKNNGECYSALDNVPGGSYARHGSNGYCPNDGRGALNINNVFQIKNMSNVSSTLDFNTLPYTSLGCWSDQSNSLLYALRRNEGKRFASILDGNPLLRTDAINKCYQVAQLRGHNVFALQNGGECYSLLDVVPGGSYARYGSYGACLPDGRGNSKLNHVYQIKNGTGPSFDFDTLPYTSLGCWKDTSNALYSALRLNEGSSILDANYADRADAINKCYQVARLRGHNVFALQNGGQCWSLLDNVPRGSYSRYGNSGIVCYPDGRGSVLSNHVYQIKNAPGPSFDYTTLPYSNIGCWADKTNSLLFALRLNEGKAFASILDGNYVTRTDAINKCYQVALIRRHNVFGLKGGGECYSALDVVPGGSYARYGNSGVLCYPDGRGGTNANQVYEINNATGPLVDYTALPYNTLGCWIDNSNALYYALRRNEGTSTILDGNYAFRTDAVNKCYQVAQLRGHNVFGLKNGGECFSILDIVPGGRYTVYGRAPTCPKDGRGAINNLNVYHIKNATGAYFDWSILPYSSLGCFQDVNAPIRNLGLNEGSSAILDGHFATRTDAISKCYQVAQSRGHNVFALQNGGQCYSSFDLVPGGDYMKSGFSTNCPFDGKGALLVNHVYKITNATGKILTFTDLPYRSGLPYHSLGCWKDVSFPKVMNSQERSDPLLRDSPSVRENAVFKCYQVAAKRGHNIFAVQAGSCYSKLDTVPRGSYAQHGRAPFCPQTGRGAININHVYRIV